MKGHLLSSAPQGSSAEQVGCVCYCPTERPQAKAVYLGSSPTAGKVFLPPGHPCRMLNLLIEIQGAPTQAEVRVNLCGAVSTATGRSDVVRDRLRAQADGRMGG